MTGTQAWRQQAACRDHPDPDVFFRMADGTRAGSAGRPSRQHDPAAFAACRACPVTAPCLDAALRRTSTQGVWGGTTQAQRYEIRAQRGYPTDRPEVSP